MSKNVLVATREPARIASIQGLRGVAACLVAAMHCLTSKGGLTDAASPLRHQITMVLCAVGGSGIDIFFAISGFIIFSLAERRIRTSAGFGQACIFLLRRLGRIYPLYWVTIVLILAAASWATRDIPSYHSSISIGEIFLLTNRINVQPPAWTLAFELWFYSGTAALMLLPSRFFGRAMLMWGTVQAMLLVWCMANRSGSNWYMIAQPQVMDFFLGCIIGYACSRKLLSRFWAVALLWLAIGVFTMGTAICYVRLPTGSLTPGERLLYWGTSAAATIWALVSLEVKTKMRTPFWLQRLGDWSYSIYLWHYTVLASAFCLGLDSLLGSHLLLQATLAFLATLCVAPLSYRFIELPTMQVTQKIVWAERSPA